MARLSLLKSVSLFGLGLTLPLLTLATPQPAKAASNPLCAKVKYGVSVCVEKKGQGVEIYSKLTDYVTSQKQYIGLDGGAVTLGTIDVWGTHAQVQGGIKRDPMRLEAKAEACFRNNCTSRSLVFNLSKDGTPLTASDSEDPKATGSYQLFWDGQQVGYEPSWTRAQVIKNLEWNKQKYPDKVVEGFFNGRKIGYELYFDGKRAGFEPGWNRDQAIKNLQWNKTNNPNVQVEGFLNGEEVGFELFWDGKRVGFEPGWSREQAIKNLEWNKQKYPDKVVTGFLNGERVGYELYFNGTRAGFEPSWNRDRAVQNLAYNRQAQSAGTKVEATFNGVPLP